MININSKKNSRKIVCLFLSVLLFFTTITTSHIIAEEVETNIIEEYVEHEAIIITADIDSVVNENQTYELLGELEDGNIYLIRDEELTSGELIETLKENELVSEAEFNWLKQEDDPELDEEIANEVETLVEEISEEENKEEKKIADATKYQWSMNNDGRMLGTGKGVDMGYSQWLTQEDPGLKEVVVAVIDCGVDIYHDDLNIWQDPGNIGLWGTYPNADKFGFNNADGGDEEKYYIERNHGTHCAGIIGALWNGEGISGVAPNAKIMSVHHDDCFASFVECFEYIVAACEAGVPVKVASNSWGTGAVSSNILNKLVYELGEKYDVVSVFSAGNSYNDDDKTSENAAALADNPYAIVVGAINPNGTPAEFSCYGQNNVDIYAPGTMIISTDVNDFPYEEEEDKEDRLNYYPEFDSDYISLQTFDGNNTDITFNTLINNGAYINKNMGYDDSNCLFIPRTLIKQMASDDGTVLVFSDTDLDISAIKDKKYLAFKFLPIKEGKLDTFISTYYIPLVAEDGTTYRYSGLLNAQYSSATGWGSAFIDLTNFDYDWELDQTKEWNVDWDHFYLQFKFNIQNDDYESILDFDLCLDMFAAGDDLVPYVFMSGTSMACPAVAGEAAVIFGTYPDMKADEVVERILSSVKKLDTLDGKCNSEGIANVDGALGNKLTPYIEEIKILSNNKIKVSGNFFSYIKGVEYKPENDNSYTKLNYKQTGDSLIVDIPNNFVGGNAIIRVTNQYGTSPIKKFELGNNKNYEYYDTVDVNIPSEIEEVLAAYDGCSLTAYNDHIYFLQQVADVTAKYQGELDNVPNKMVRYGINDGKWEIINLPMELINKAGINNIWYYSATPYKGKLYVLVVTSPKEYNRGCMLTLDENDNWKIDDEFTKEVPTNNFTMANINNELYLIGATDGKILKWDSENKEFVTYGETERLSPNVAIYNNDIWISGGMVPGLSGETISSVERLTCTVKDEELGPRYTTKDEYKLEEFVEQMKDIYYAVAAVKDGVVVVGPTSINNESDTYFIPIDEDENPKEAISLNMRASNNPLRRPAAIGYKDQLYVYAPSSGSNITFSYTRMETNPLLGDYVAPEHHDEKYRPVATAIE
ncbi:MAG: S8 family serine peptidase [Erysipelotrichaceae bacterium]|nr:S8 family serine peptidase [Erysipelotrichaceae bacterium]